MNRPAHMAVGTLAGSVGYILACKWLEERPTIGGLLLCAGGGAVVACLPDVLEPPRHPNHRAFAHSLMLNGAIAVGARKLWLNPNVPPQEKIAWTSFTLAYISHPILDATTPMSLPVI